MKQKCAPVLLGNYPFEFVLRCYCVCDDFGCSLGENVDFFVEGAIVPLSCMLIHGIFVLLQVQI